MAENNNPASEPLQKTGQAASTAVNTARASAKFAKGAAKLGKSIAAAAKGASSGGVFWGYCSICLGEQTTDHQDHDCGVCRAFNSHSNYSASKSQDWRSVSITDMDKRIVYKI